MVDPRRMPVAAYALTLLLMALWGGNYVAIKVGVTYLPPVGSAGIRFVLGMLAVFVWTWLHRSALRIERGDWTPVLVNACLLFVQISLLNLGARRTTGANATVLMSVYPVPLALGAHFMIPGDRLTLRRLGGFALSLLGIVAVFAHDLSLSAANWVGNLIVVSSAILLGLKEVYMKRCLVTVSRDKLVFWQALLSLPLFGAYTILAEGPDWHQCLSRAEGNNLFAAAVAIGYQGVIVVGFCFMSWAWLLARYQASKLAALTFFTPLCGMLFSHWMLGDALGPGLWLGAALVAAGVTIGATEAPEE